VGVAAVGLDDETTVAPEEVGPVGADRDLGLGERKVVPCAQLDEGRLDLALGSCRDVVLEEAAQAGVARGVARKFIEEDAQVGQVEPVASLRLAQRRLELLLVEDGREVDQRAPEGGDRVGVPLGDVVGPQCRDAAQIYSASATPPGVRRHRDLRAPGWQSLADLPQSGGAQVA